MAIELSKQQRDELIPSIRRYLREELDQEVSEMRAGFLLDYVMGEIAPLAYNRGVRDAEAYLRAKVEDLPGTCFAEEMTYWAPKKKGRP